jgi:hypothetical protein
MKLIYKKKFKDVPVYTLKFGHHPKYTSPLVMGGKSVSLVG